MSRVTRIAVACAALASATGVRAQEAMYTEAATMPSRGTGVVRAQFHYSQFGANAGAGIDETQQVETMVSVQYGIAKAAAIRIDVPVIPWRHEEMSAGHHVNDAGVEDITALFKYRVYKHDSGGVDTIRAVVFAGVEMLSGDSRQFSSLSASPFAGGVLTIVRGRHGFNQELTAKINPGGDNDHNFGGDGTDNALFINSAYLFRFYPAAYTSQTTGAYYATAELLHTYETNGDWEGRASVGVMFEGRQWAWEAMVLLPLYDRLDHRAELDIGIGFGLRFSF